MLVSRSSFGAVSGDHGLLRIRFDDARDIARAFRENSPDPGACRSVAKRRQIFFRQPEQPHRRAQPPPMFRMRRMLELLLQMHKRARGLDQPFEIMRVLRRDRIVQPDLLENIVRFVVTLLVPASEKGPVIGMRGDSVARCTASSLPALRRIAKSSRLCSWRALT